MDEKISLNNQAAELAENGKYADAEKLLRQAVEKFPDDSAVCFNLALTLLKTKKEDESLIWFDRAVDNTGDNAGDIIKKGETALSCALALSGASLYENIEKYLEAAEKTETENPAYWNLRGIVEFTGRDYSSALVFFEKAVSLDSQFSDAWFNLRDTYKMLGREKESIQAGRKYSVITGKTD